MLSRIPLQLTILILALNFSCKQRQESSDEKDVSYSDRENKSTYETATGQGRNVVYRWALRTQKDVVYYRKKNQTNYVFSEPDLNVNFAKKINVKSLRELLVNNKYPESKITIIMEHITKNGVTKIDGGMSSPVYMGRAGVYIPPQENIEFFKENKQILTEVFALIEKHGQEVKVEDYDKLFPKDDDIYARSIN